MRSINGHAALFRRLAEGERRLQQTQFLESARLQRAMQVHVVMPKAAPTTTEETQQ